VYGLTKLWSRINCRILGRSYRRSPHANAVSTTFLASQFGAQFHRKVLAYYRCSPLSDRRSDIGYWSSRFFPLPSQSSEYRAPGSEGSANQLHHANINKLRDALATTFDLTTRSDQMFREVVSALAVFV